MAKLEETFFDEPVGIFDDLDITLGLCEKVNSQNDALVKVNNQNEQSKASNCTK